MRERLNARQVSGEAITDRESTTKRVIRSSGRLATKLAIFGTLGLFGGVALTTVVPTEVPFGPGTARATASLDGHATLEGGFIGSARQEIDGPSLGPLDLGVTLRVDELPVGVSERPETQIEELSVNELFGDINTSDIQRYGELYRAVSAQSDEITGGLRDHTLKMALLIGSAAFALYELPGKKGRRAVKENLQKPGIYLPLLVLAYAGHVNLPEAPDHTWHPTGSEYSGTPLQDVEISGEIAQYVNNFGGRIMRYVQTTDEFYDQVLRNAQNTAPNEVLLGQRPEDQENFTFLFFTDLHCNTGIPRTLAYIASVAGANVAVDGGDSVFSGSGYERYCVQQEMRAFNRSNVEVVAVSGNHDSETTEGYMEQYGAHVLNGEVQTVGGISFLGDSDPYESPFGQGIRQRGTETNEDLGARLAEIGCAQNDRVMVLVTHRSRAADESLGRGCEYLALSGHTHEREVFFADWAESYSTTNPGFPYVQIIGGTAGGAQERTPTIGRLQQASEFMLISVNGNGQLQYLQDLSISTAGNLIVGEIIDNPYYSG